MRWRVVDPSVFPVEASNDVAIAMRAMAMAVSKRQYGTHLLPEDLHGPSKPSDEPAIDAGGQHLHAYWLPEDRDRDGLIDHLAVQIAVDAGTRSRTILADCNNITLRNQVQSAIVPATPTAMAFAIAHDWVSATPYIAPRHRYGGRSGQKERPGLSAIEQLAADIARFRLPDGSPLPQCEIFEAMPPHLPDPDAFQMTGGRQKNRSSRKRERGYFFISFAAPIASPVCFGHNSHFGMGQFRPVD